MSDEDDRLADFFHLDERKSLPSWLSENVAEPAPLTYQMVLDAIETIRARELEPHQHETFPNMGVCITCGALLRPNGTEHPVDQARREGKKLVVCTPEDEERIRDAVADLKALVVVNDYIEPGTALIADPEKMRSIEDVFAVGDMMFQRQDPTPCPGQDTVSWLLRYEIDRIRREYTRHDPTAIVRITGI